MLFARIPLVLIRRFFLFQVTIFLFAITCIFTNAAEGLRPNVLWISSEDHGVEMGCYGDVNATTPNVDALAKRSLRYTKVWSNAPVCAPARTTLITGIYATTSGGEHMRSRVNFPQELRLLPGYLRELGYYCSNNLKEDYNLKHEAPAWHESSKKAHWRNRSGKEPFFAVFNSSKSHESQIRARPHQQKLDPAKVRIPSYHPDTPEVRRDWAQYYDAVTAADADAGIRLAELEADGLADDTIIFYFGDHGSGMPRSKRWPCHSGLHVPLIVYIPEKYKHLRPADYQPGGTSDRLIQFVDFAPTVIRLAGGTPHASLQGRAFLGQDIPPATPYLFGFRGRMDERLDLIRSISDGRYVYVRHFMPHLPYAQHLNYLWQTPTMQVWEKLFEAGKLNEVQSQIFKPKASEELFDLQTDRDEVVNLANSPEHQEIRKTLRAALEMHLRDTRDLGFLPEGERTMRAQNGTLIALGKNDSRYPYAEIFAMADHASSRKLDHLPKLKAGLKHADAAVRYWAATGYLILGKSIPAGDWSDLSALQNDSSPEVAIQAIHAILAHTAAQDESLLLNKLLTFADTNHQTSFTAMAALTALDALGDKVKPLAPALAKLPKQVPQAGPRYSEYAPRLLTDLIDKLK